MTLNSRYKISRETPNERKKDMMNKRDDGKDLLGEELAVGGVGAAPAEAEAEGGIEPIGNPSFHCSNISSGSFPPFLPEGDKDPIRGERREGGKRRGKSDILVGSTIGAETKNTHGSGRVGRGCGVFGWQKKEADIGS